MINYDINKTYVIMTGFIIFVVWCCIWNWCIRNYSQHNNEDMEENDDGILPNDTDKPPRYEEINETFE